MAENSVKKNIAWMGGASFLGQIITWSTTIIVARILVPEDYGLIALAGLFTIFANYICMMGVSAAVVQADEVSDTQIRGLYSFSLLMGVLMFCVGLGAAPLMAWWFDEPRLQALVVFQNVIFLLGAPKSLQWSLLARETRFDTIAKIETGSRVLAALIGVTLAFAGFGFWTLAAQGVLLELFQFLGFTILRPIRPSIRIKWDEVKELLAFGFKILCRNCLMQVNASLVVMIFGKLSTHAFLGAYQFSRQLTNMPFEKIIALVNRVIFPYLSKDKGNVHAMREWTLKAADLQSLILSPFYCVLFFSARETILILLGPDWSAAVFPLKIFCVVSIFKLIDSYAGIALTALAKLGLQIWFMIAQIVIIPGGILLLTRAFDAEQSLYLWVIAYPPMCIYLGRKLMRMVGLGFRELIQRLRPTVVAHVFLILNLILVDTFLTGPHLLTLPVKIGSGMLVYFAALHFQGGDKIRLLLAFVPGLGPRKKAVFAEEKINETE